MIVALAYCQKDQDIALQLFEWIKDLGGTSKHQLVLCHDARCPQNVVTDILNAARGGFEKVTDIVAHAEVDGWPQGANYMFKTCAGYIEHLPGVSYFFWLEPDAIPLTPDWLDKIETEYKASGKAFMGDDVNVEGIPRHMSGVGVYQNPIHKLAGNINFSHETAWDMVAKDQIIPNAHFTKLIEHAWRHPAFTDPSELNTQIRPEAVLFHASKDGSLIKLLVEQRSQVQAEHRSVDSPAIEGENPSPLNVTCDIFIRTYPKDYPWLSYCLASIEKYAKGFRKIWVISPETIPFTPPNVEWKVMNEETEDGYLAQQIHKLYADVITDYQADYILIVDSDTLFTRPVTPKDFFTRIDVPGPFHSSTNYPIWYYTPYDKIETPWKPIIEKFMGQPVEYEFMRRLPMMIPRWLFPRLREYCHSIHGRIISEYIKAQPYREFSEFNALGAYAYAFHRDKFHWVNTLTTRMPQPLARQFFSWGGITDEVKTEIQTILGGSKETEQSSFCGAMPVDAMNVPTQTPLTTVSMRTESSVNQQDKRDIPLASERKAETGLKVGIHGGSQDFNGEMSVGDHVRALADYADLPWKRQYVIRELKKAKLVPKWTRKNK